MALEDYIPKEILLEEGFVKVTDKEDLKRKNLVSIEDLESVRLNRYDIAEFLNVGEGRVYRFFRVKDIKLDEDGKIPLSKVLKMNWSELTDLEETGDRQRRRTIFYD